MKDTSLNFGDEVHSFLALLLAKQSGVATGVTVCYGGGIGCVVTECFREGFQGRVIVMDDPVKRFSELPGRLLLDTCILNLLQDEDEYLWEGVLPEDTSEEELDPDLKALRNIFIINERASFQLVISPLTIAEVANVQDFRVRERKVRWVLDVLDNWLITVDDLMDREGQGGAVRTRFKLTPQLQELESKLMTLKDFQRDPFDRLLLLQYQMADCDAFLTVDLNTIWKHRKELSDLGIRVIRPTEFWDLIQPWARLWM